MRELLVVSVIKKIPAPFGAFYKYAIHTEAPRIPDNGFTVDHITAKVRTAKVLEFVAEGRRVDIVFANTELKFLEEVIEKAAVETVVDGEVITYISKLREQADRAVIRNVYLQQKVEEAERLIAFKETLREKEAIGFYTLGVLLTCIASFIVRFIAVSLY